jgi:hypothetical protein
VKISNFSVKSRNKDGDFSKNLKRYFGSKQKGKGQIDTKKDKTPTQQKFVKPIDIGGFSPSKEPIFQLENGYYLVYYHRQRKYTMFLLYLRYLIPIFGLIYLIKKNPFYKTYPIMLPAMVTVLIIILFRTMRYSAKTNRMLHQILIDPTGTEATFIYKNRFVRKLRNDNLEETLLIQSLTNPPQGNEYAPLKGQLFPEEYPFRFEVLSEANYFWLKYYVSQHNFFALSKHPHYINYEVLCNIFATNTINFSEAKIYKLLTSKLSQFQLEFMLETMNQYSNLNFAKRQERSAKIESFINESEPEQSTIKDKGLSGNKMYEKIMNEPKHKAK